MKYLIEHSTATEYQVKKGDYIQIINPFGRQCSDFLAFDTAKLEKGIERGLDPLTTRTFMGASISFAWIYFRNFLIWTKTQ